MQSFLKMNYNDLATQTEELMLAAVLDDRIVQNIIKQICSTF